MGIKGVTYEPIRGVLGTYGPIHLKDWEMVGNREICTVEEGPDGQ